MTRRGPRDAGFTLIEALVAFVVLALFMVVVQRGAVGAVDGSGRAEARLEAVRIAQTLIDSPTLDLGGTGGRLAGHDWTVRYERLDIPAGAPGSAGGSTFQPMRMIVEVDAGRGAPVLVETVRLIRVGGGA